MVQVEQSYQRIFHMQWLHPQYTRMENCQIRHSISVITVCEWQLTKMMKSTYVLLMYSIFQESSCKYKCQCILLVYYQECLLILETNETCLHLYLQLNSWETPDRASSKQQCCMCQTIQKKLEFKAISWATMNAASTGQKKQTNGL